MALFRPLLTLLFGAAFGLLTVGTETTQAQVLLNGSFESPALPASDISPGAGASWIASGPSNEVFILSNDYFDAGNTPYGSQYLDLQSGICSASQTVTGFVAGETYVLSAAIANGFGIGYPVAQLTLSVTGVANASETFVAPGNGEYYNGAAIPFQTVALTFTATSSGSATITLENPGNLSGPTGLDVDNVTLTPEPSTLALLFGGLGLLAFWSLRSRRV